MDMIKAVKEDLAENLIKDIVIYLILSYSGIINKDTLYASDSFE